jgi:hypothetical protein
MITKGDALISLRPGAVWSIKGDTVEWLSPKVEPPSEKEINDKITELQAEYDSKQYQRDRLKEYPSIQECIHAILDDDLNALQAKRSAVKAKYQKPE